MILVLLSSCSGGAPPPGADTTGPQDVTDGGPPPDTDDRDRGEAGTETASDGGSSDVQAIPIPWEPGPPDPDLVIHDGPFVQELNHTWNEAPWHGPLVALVGAPAAWGWDHPTLVTPLGVLLQADGGLEEAPVVPGDEPLVDATAGLEAVFVASASAFFRLDAAGAPELIHEVPEGDAILRIQGDATGVDLLTTGGFARWNGIEVDFLPQEFGEGTAPTAALRTAGRLILAADYYVLEVLDEPGRQVMFPALTLDVEVGIPVAILPAVTLPQPLDFVLVGTAGIAGYDETAEGWARVDVPLFAGDRVPLVGARRAVLTPGGGFAVAASGGAFRVVDDGDGPEWRVYAAERWVPDPDVRDVMPVDDGGLGQLWFASAAGPGWVTRAEWTLEDRMAHGVERILARHDRDGAVADSHLATPGDLSTNIPWDSDNDGGWTSYWVLAECLRWTVTGDPEARAHFDRSLDRMLSLRTLTGTDWFLARAVIRIDGCLLDDCDAPDDGEWFLSPDGEWWVKADTSNDEVTSHMFMMGQAFDLCADGDQREAIAAHVRGIIGGILDHGWFLLDPQDMKPTTYGQWDPFYVNTWPAGAWGDGGLRSAQILGALNLAIHVTGEDRFREGKRELLEAHHYDLNVTHIGDPETYPFCCGSGDCDELGYQAFVPLLRYETDPALRDLWMEGWRRMDAHLRLQEDALWDLANAVFEGDAPDLSRSLRWLWRYPVDLIRFPLRNEGRMDLIPAPEYYFLRDPDALFRMRSDGRIVPEDERPNDRHNTPRYQVFGGLGAGVEMDDADLLYTYWLGRRYGFIQGPEN
ncbi:MAG: hypothetical protein FJ098_08090 [Deltaproteobacteria bacterium]|nr:hypothetical protein [Deltaproteobacteria bacterium]